MSIEWASGLFVGEGTYGRSKRSTYLSLGMLDEQAVRRFAACLESFMPPRKTWKSRDGISVWKDGQGMFRVHLTAGRADAAYEAMKPYLTPAKGGQ